MTSQQNLAAQLDEQITRFGLQDTKSNCCGICAYVDDGEIRYPEGQIRIDGDNGGGSIVEAVSTIENLRSIEPTGDFETDQDLFYGALVLAAEGAQ